MVPHFFFFFNLLFKHVPLYCPPAQHASGVYPAFPRFSLSVPLHLSVPLFHILTKENHTPLPKFSSVQNLTPTSCLRELDAFFSQTYLSEDAILNSFIVFIRHLLRISLPLYGL